MNEEDHTRLEEFRQFRREIRKSTEYLIVGIDVAKDRHHAFFGTATGKTLFKRLVFENDIEGFRKLLVQAEAMKVQGGLKKVVFGLEPTGNYHKPLGEHLMRCGQEVVLVSGVAAHENRKTLDGRWDSNDTRDAANVADLLSQGKCLFYEFPVGGLQDLRNLLSLKRRLKRQEHGYRVRHSGSDQAIFRISLGNRSRNMCFQALYYSFWHQNGPHRKSFVHEVQTGHLLNRLGYHIPTRSPKKASIGRNPATFS